MNFFLKHLLRPLGINPFFLEILSLSNTPVGLRYLSNFIKNNNFLSFYKAGKGAEILYPLRESLEKEQSR